MKGLLAIEWLKLRKYRTFWILSGFFLALLPLWNYGISNGIMKFGSNNINLLSQAYAFSSVWQNLGFWTSIFVVFISILTIILTTNEYQFRTNRQNVIDGQSRMDFYHAKWLLVVTFSLLTTFYVFLTGLVFGVSYGSVSGFPGNIEFLFYTWLLALNYYSFGLLLSLFFKRSGIAIGIFFLYSMIIESLVKNLGNWLLDSNLGNYMPLQCSDELLPFPLIDLLKKATGIGANASASSYVIISFVWITIYYFVGRKKLQTSDW